MHTSFLGEMVELGSALSIVLLLAVIGPKARTAILDVFEAIFSILFI